MRELYRSEMEAVSAAGVVTDDANVTAVLKVFDDMCEATEDAANKAGESMLEFSVNVSNKVVNAAVNIIDASFTSVFNSIAKLFG